MRQQTNDNATSVSAERTALPLRRVHEVLVHYARHIRAVRNTVWSRFTAGLRS
jgi:hypothetical protein